MELEQRPFDLRASIEESFDLVAQKALGKNLDLLYMVDPLVPAFIIGDVTRLRQVLVNLVGNAIKYTRPGGRVSVTAAADNGVIRVTVADTGIGITAEDLSKVFDVFYRAPNARALEKVGTGLGLSIVKRLVEDHSGAVAVSSTPGQGAVFTVTLPVARQA